MMWLQISRFHKENTLFQKTSHHDFSSLLIPSTLSNQMNMFFNSLESVDSPKSKCTADPYLDLACQGRITSSVVSVLDIACIMKRKTESS